MSDRPKNSLSMDDFPGMVTGVDTRDLPAGFAEEQINIRSERVGELTVRSGFRPVTFESEQ